jgi:hypothetical protein
MVLCNFGLQFYLLNEKNCLLVAVVACMRHMHSHSHYVGYKSRRELMLANSTILRVGIKIFKISVKTVLSVTIALW